MAALDDQLRLAALRQTQLTACADPVLDRFAALVARLLAVPVALVSLVDDARQYFPGLAGLGAPWDRERSTPLSHSLCQHVVRSGDPLVVADARAVPELAESAALSELGVVAYAGFPLVDAHGQVLGSLCAIDHQVHEWDSQELATLADLAALCSAELTLRSTAETAREAAARLALLGAVTQAVTTTLDVQEIASRLARLLVPAMASWSVVHLVNVDAHPGVAGWRHVDPDRADDLERFAREQVTGAAADGVCASVLHTGEALQLGPDAPSLATAGLLASVGTAWLLAVPLRARGQVLGCLMLGRAADRPDFSQAELHDALDVGRRVGLALDNAELFAQQRAAAEVLQRSLLTRLPAPPHAELLARYVPAADAVQVGGDWYDAFVQPEGACLLVVGDVMGHDMAAAAQMGQLRNLLRGVCWGRPEPPAQALTRLDRTLSGLRVDTLATAVLARVDPPLPDGRIRLVWSNAGHPPPALVTADGAVRLLQTPGELLLGLDPATPRTDELLVLPPGATLLLYTDGLVERRDSPLETGLVRLRQALGGLVGLPLDELCDRLLERMLPTRSEDDVALLAVRARPPSALP